MENTTDNEEEIIITPLPEPLEADDGTELVPTSDCSTSQNDPSTESPSVKKSAVRLSKSGKPLSKKKLEALEKARLGRIRAHSNRKAKLEKLEREEAQARQLKEKESLFNPWEEKFNKLEKQMGDLLDVINRTQTPLPTPKPTQSDDAISILGCSTTKQPKSERNGGMLKEDTGRLSIF